MAASHEHPQPQNLDQLLAELEQLGAENDGVEDDRRKKMLNLERPTAELIDMMLRSTRRRRVLEIGTSNGYSTLWIARALRDIDGTLQTIEYDPSKHELAANNLRRAGLHSVVTQHLGDATEIIRNLVQNLELPFDCVFFDANRVSAPRQLEILLPHLAPDVLLLTDNATSHPSELREYFEYVGTLPAFRTTVVEIGKGLHIAHRPLRP